MKTEKNIFIAFLLNLLFSVFEFFGGIITGSIAIISDAVHDIGDAASIGVSYFLEKKSKKQPDDKYTYGYVRYSIIGSVITTLILLCGSVLVVFNAVMRIIEPAEINYDGMIIFAVIGVAVNFFAAFVTREGDSLNQKAVNLHMLEDILGWAVVLVGAVVMRFTDFWIIDPLMSVAVAGFIFINASKNLAIVLDLFLEKTPKNVDINELKEHLLNISGVFGVHHIHLWSMDGVNNYATLHVVTNLPPEEIKPLIREELREHGINHVTVETEKQDEICGEEVCRVDTETAHHHHHHHHH